MFNLSLSPALINTLTEVSKNIPKLSHYVQERLIHELSIVLSGQPYYKLSITQPEKKYQTYLLPNKFQQDDLTYYNIYLVNMI